MLRKERKVVVVVEGLNVEVLNTLELEINKVGRKLEVTQTISIVKKNCLPQGKFKIELLADVDNEIHNPGKVKGLMKSFITNIEAEEIIASRYIEIEINNDVLELLLINNDLDATAERLYLAQLVEKLDIDAKNLTLSLLGGNLYGLSASELYRPRFLATTYNFERKAGILFDDKGNIYIEGVGLFTKNSTLMKLNEFVERIQEVETEMKGIQLPANVENCIYNILKEAN